MKRIIELFIKGCHIKWLIRRADKERRLSAKKASQNSGYLRNALAADAVKHEEEMFRLQKVLESL